MELKTFKEFLNEEYAYLNIVKRIDEAIFKKQANGGYIVSESQLKIWKRKQRLLTESEMFDENDTDIDLIETFQADQNSDEGIAALDELIERKKYMINDAINEFVQKRKHLAAVRGSLESDCISVLTDAIEDYDTSSGEEFDRYAQRKIEEALSKHQWFTPEEFNAFIKQYQEESDPTERKNLGELLLNNLLPLIRGFVSSFLGAGHPSFNEIVDDSALLCTKPGGLFDKYDEKIFPAFIPYLKTSVRGLCNNEKNSHIRKHRVETDPTTASIDDKVGGAKGDWADKEGTLGDIVPDENQKMPWDETDEELSNHAVILRDWLEQLPDVEKDAITTVFLSGDKNVAQTELAQKLHMSKVGAGKLLRRVIIKLHKLAQENGFVSGPGKNEDEDKFYENIFRTAIGKKTK